MLGHRLGSVIPEVFSELNDSATPRHRFAAVPHTAAPALQAGPSSARPRPQPALSAAMEAAIRPRQGGVCRLLLPPACFSPSYGVPSPDLRPEVVLVGTLRDKVSVDRFRPARCAEQELPCPRRWKSRAGVPGMAPALVRRAGRRSSPKNGGGRFLLKSGTALAVPTAFECLSTAWEWEICV